MIYVQKKSIKFSAMAHGNVLNSKFVVKSLADNVLSLYLATFWCKLLQGNKQSHLQLYIFSNNVG